MLSYADSRLTYEAFRKLDFVAVAEVSMTPTAPWRMWSCRRHHLRDQRHRPLRHRHGYILARPKIVEPPEECWPDMKIMNELGRRVSDPSLCMTTSSQFLEDVVKPAGMTYAQFVRRDTSRDRTASAPGRKGLQDPHGEGELKLSVAVKFRLSAMAGLAGPSGSGGCRLSLVLTSAKSGNYLHSSYRWWKSSGRGNPGAYGDHPETAFSWCRRW